MVKKKNVAPYAIGIVCLIMAFAITMQIRSVKYNSAINIGNDIRVSSLQTQLQKEKEKNEELYKQLLLYKEEQQSYRQIAAESSEASAVLVKQLVNSENLAGLTDVTGPGVIIVVRDNPKTKSSFLEYGEEDLVHEVDLIWLINEIKSCGAEAISINGERIVAMSEVRCVGPTVIVNGNRCAAPFEIKAIGDAETLDNGLNMKGGILMTMRDLYPIDITLKRVSSMKIDAYSGSIKFKHAVPLKGNER